MFITRNKKDYERHVRSIKHRETHLDLKDPSNTMDMNMNMNMNKEEIIQKPPMCPNCNKVYKSRTSIYTHMKKCGVSTTVLQSPSIPPSIQISTPLTPEQIQYILIENKILKELLKNTIHGSIM